MKETLLIVEDKHSAARFHILEPSADLAHAELNSLELNLDEFKVSELQDGKIFDYYKMISYNEDKELKPNEMLAKMIEISRIENDDTEIIHWEADKVLRSALYSKYKLAVRVFENMEKWYA